MHKSFPHGIHGSKYLLLCKFQFYVFDLIQKLLPLINALILLKELWEGLGWGGSCSYCLYPATVKAWESAFSIKALFVHLLDIGPSISNGLINSGLIHGIFYFSRLLNGWHILEGSHGLHLSVDLCLESGSMCCPVQHVSLEVIVLSLHLFFVVVLEPLEVVNRWTLKRLFFLLFWLLLQQKHFYKWI